MKIPSRLASVLLLAGLTLAAVLVHGYHPAAEDSEVYLPSVLKLLDPALYPHDGAFALSHARWTLFPYLIAGSMRLTRLPFGIALVGWHFASVLFLLWACHRIARRCFREEHAIWCGVALVASLLTLPVAGTALYIMDQYVTSRSLATPGALLVVAAALEGKRGRAAGWLVFTVAVHPLTGLFAAALWAIFELFARRHAAAAALLALLPVISPAYAEVLRGQPYLVLTKWAWYEWLGALAPLAILAWFGRLARKRRLGPMEILCQALIAFQVLFLAAALVISVPGRLLSLSRIQPMRSLQLLYILMFLLMGCLLGQHVLRRRAWLWALLFLPLCAGMCFAQLELFPASPHLEWPWSEPRNPWVKAFGWIRLNTPKDAFFALDPENMRRPGEDQHGFRVLARRSRLADRVKDSGPVSLMPDLASKWLDQVNAQRGLAQFQPADFQSLRSRFGVTWVVLERASPPLLVCPYHDGNLFVCRTE